MRFTEKKEEKDMLAFNMAADYANTLADGLRRTESLWRNGNLKGAMWSLKSVWNTASPFLSNRENNEILKAFINLQKTLLNDHNITSSNNFFEEINRHIRGKLNERGLLIPVSEDPRFIFGKSK